jgi:hypothetical protein
MLEDTDPVSPNDEGAIRLITYSEGTIPGIRGRHPVLRFVFFIVVVAFRIGSFELMWTHLGITCSLLKVFVFVLVLIIRLVWHLDISLESLENILSLVILALHPPLLIQSFPKRAHNALLKRLLGRKVLKPK